MKLKIWHKNILSSFVIMLGGFILFNVAFLLAAFVISTSQRIIGMPQNAAPNLLSRALYLVLIFIISWFVLKSKLYTLAKATYLTMPLMVVLVMLGLLLYQQPKSLIAIIGALIISVILLYLYKKKLPWQYYFAALYVAVLGLCIMLFNIEI
jgi:hypothetical protein